MARSGSSAGGEARRRGRARRGTEAERRPSLRRWLRIGPGLILALVAIWILWPHLREEGPGSRSPSIQRTRVDPLPNPPPTAPDPGWLLKQRQALGLSADQVRKLTRLRDRWDRDTQALREELAQATAEFERGMPAGGERGVTMEQLRERAAPVSELSRQLVDARRAWWEEARAVLTAHQRRQAEAAWAQRFSPRGDRDRKRE